MLNPSATVAIAQGIPSAAATIDGVKLRGRERVEWVAARLQGPQAIADLTKRLRDKWRAKKQSLNVTQNYRVLPAGTNGIGHTVAFCYTIRRNYLGYFVTWQQTVNSNGDKHKRTRLASFKSKGSARRTAERRLAAWVPPAPRVARAVKPTPDPKTVELQREEAKLKRWRTRAKRAATAIKKCERRIKRLTRRSDVV